MSLLLCTTCRISLPSHLYPYLIQKLPNMNSLNLLPLALLPTHLLFSSLRKLSFSKSIFSLMVRTHLGWAANLLYLAYTFYV